MRTTSLPLLVACASLWLASPAHANTGVRCVTALEAKPSASSTSLERSQAGKAPTDKTRCPKAIAWRLPDPGERQAPVATARRATGRV